MLNALVQPPGAVTSMLNALVQPPGAVTSMLDALLHPSVLLLSWLPSPLSFPFSPSAQQQGWHCSGRASADRNSIEERLDAKSDEDPIDCCRCCCGR